MFIIKLDAIGSTNTYLKEYIKDHMAQNFTTVVAETQTQGRGQMGSSWETQANKNLTFSIFVKNYIQNIAHVFDLNCLLTNALMHVLTQYDLPELHVKWPNDILSANKKIVGVLIENTVKSDGKIESVIGIGINVNQIDFTGLPHAGSIHTILGHEIDKEILLTEVLNQIFHVFEEYLRHGADAFWKYYHEKLFRKDIPSVFLDQNNQEFTGIIKKVTTNGLLEVQLVTNERKHFGIKEVQLIY